jgi:hypothetical protein
MGSVAVSDAENEELGFRRRRRSYGGGGGGEARGRSGESTAGASGQRASVVDANCAASVAGHHSRLPCTPAQGCERGAQIRGPSALKPRLECCCGRASQQVRLNGTLF